MDQLIEIIAILSGITSVWFSRKENIWVYPTGLIGTILYVYISFRGELYGEASVNLYYTIMSLYGWYNWLRRDQQQTLVVHITHSSPKEWRLEIAFFSVLPTFNRLLVPVPSPGQMLLLLPLRSPACG